MPDNYLDRIGAFLARRYPQPTALWNSSSNNTLAPDWLYATPMNVWGLDYAAFKQAVPGEATDFHLQACSSASGPAQQCAALAATVLEPGASAARLLVGHSYQLVDALYAVMCSATVCLDFTTLTPPTGEFLTAFKNALTFISNKDEAERPVIRILFSDPLPNVPPLNAIDFLTSITEQLDPARKMEIYVTVMSSSFASWNHAKIVVADGARALVGGHNMWGPHYLGKNPVFDVSMTLSGSAALHAQDYANGLWEYTLFRAGHLGGWINAGSASEITLHASYAFNARKRRCDMAIDSYPAADLYSRCKARFPAQPVAPGARVLAVGRGGNTRSSYFLPTAYSFLFPFTEPSDEAMIELVALAQSSVRMSLQAFRLVGVNLSFLWINALFLEMGKALQRGVKFYIVLSNPNAVAGGLGPASAPYNGDQPAAINEKMLLTLTGPLGLEAQAAAALLTQGFQVGSLRYGAEATYPGAAPIPNHAKTFIVDNAVFYIGSQNLYACNLNEFGYLVEDETAARSYMANYWNPLWNFSAKTVTGAGDADIETLEKTEAMLFVFDLNYNGLLRQVWSGLLAQYKGATEPEQKAELAARLDEVITNAGFQSTLGTVLAALAKPFFSPAPPGIQANTEALRFVANLMDSVPLMKGLIGVIDTPAASTEEANRHIDGFLHDNGYQCTLLQVLGAFAEMRAKLLCYWAGSYTTWITDDGGASYGAPTQGTERRLRAAAEPAQVLPACAADVVIGTDGSVSVMGKAVASPVYNDNTLSWTAGGGNDSAGTLHFGSLSRPTLNDAFVGREFFGTVTLEGAAVWSIYGRAARAPADQPGADGKTSYTLLAVLGALALAGMLAVAGYFIWTKRSNQQEYERVGREKRRSEDGSFDEDSASPVSSPGRVSEMEMLQRSALRERTGAQLEICESLAPYEIEMTVRQRSGLASSVNQLQRTQDALREASSAQLGVVVGQERAATSTLQQGLDDLSGSLARVLSRETQASIEASTRASEFTESMFERFGENREEGLPFEVPEEIDL